MRTLHFHPAPVTVCIMNYTNKAVQHKAVPSGHHVPEGSIDNIYILGFLIPTHSYVSLQQILHILWIVKVTYYVCKCLIGAYVEPDESCQCSSVTFV
jgi:hypothetical protein